MPPHRQPRLLASGDHAPDFRLPRLEGGFTTLAEILAGGPVLLAFFKIACPVCQLTFPFLDRIHDAGTLRVYAISEDDAEGTREFHQAFGVKLPTLLDTEESGFAASNAYGLSSVPTLFLVEPTGRIERVMEGWQKRQMEALGGAGLFRPGENVPEWKAG